MSAQPMAPWTRDGYLTGENRPGSFRFDGAFGQKRPFNTRIEPPADRVMSGRPAAASYWTLLERGVRPLNDVFPHIDPEHGRKSLRRSVECKDIKRALKRAPKARTKRFVTILP